MIKKYIVELEESIFHNVKTEYGLLMLTRDAIEKAVPYNPTNVTKTCMKATWNAAMTLKDMSFDEIKEAFPGCFGDNLADRKCTIEYLVDKVQDYKKAPTIKVGDEVATKAGDTACVINTNPTGTQLLVLRKDGTCSWWDKSAVNKTGRHFSELDTLLKNLGQ